MQSSRYQAARERTSLAGRVQHACSLVLVARPHMPRHAGHVYRHVPQIEHRAHLTLLRLTEQAPLFDAS